MTTRDLWSLVRKQSDNTVAIDFNHLLGKLCEKVLVNTSSFSCSLNLRRFRISSPCVKGVNKSYFCTIYFWLLFACFNIRTSCAVH